MREQRRTASAQMAEYGTLAQKVAEADERISSLVRAAAVAADRRKDLEARLRSWTTGRSWSGASEDLVTLDPLVDAFPEDRLRRLEVLLAELAQYRDQASEARSQLETVGTELAALKADEALLAASGVLEDIAERKGRFVLALESRDALAKRIASANAEIRERLQALGSGWTLKGVLAVDRSRFSLETINRYAERIEESERTRERAEVAEVAARRELAATSAELARVRESLEEMDQVSEAPSDDTIRCLRALRMELRAATREIPDLVRSIANMDEELAPAVEALGAGWSLERIETFDTSADTTARIDEFEQRLLGLRRELDQAALRATYAGQSLQSPPRKRRPRARR